MAVHISPIGPVITQQQTHIYLLRNIYYRCCQLCIAIERGGVNASSNCVYIQPRILKKEDRLAFLVYKKIKGKEYMCTTIIYTARRKESEVVSIFLFLGGGVDEQEEGKKKSDRRS